MGILTDDELLITQEHINKKQSGTYELKEIFGKDWAHISSPTNYGARFKESVIRNILLNIELADKKSNNHHTYKIL